MNLSGIHQCPSEEWQQCLRVTHWDTCEHVQKSTCSATTYLLSTASSSPSFHSVLLGICFVVVQLSGLQWPKFTSTSRGRTAISRHFFQHLKLINIPCYYLVMLNQRNNLFLQFIYIRFEHTHPHYVSAILLDTMEIRLDMFSFLTILIQEFLHHLHESDRENHGVDNVLVRE